MTCAGLAVEGRGCPFSLRLSSSLTPPLLSWVSWLEIARAELRGGSWATELPTRSQRCGFPGREVVVPAGTSCSSVKNRGISYKKASTS